MSTSLFFSYASSNKFDVEKMFDFNFDTGYPYSEPRILPLDLNERMMALPRALSVFFQHRSSSPFWLDTIAVMSILNDNFTCRRTVAGCLWIAGNIIHGEYKVVANASRSQV
jgi:hypothetical protein